MEVVGVEDYVVGVLVEVVREVFDFVVEGEKCGEVWVGGGEVGEV